MNFYNAVRSSPLHQLQQLCSRKTCRCQGLKRNLFLVFISGDSAYAVPHYHKLYARVPHVWGNRRGQPNRSAMERPRPGGASFMIKATPAPGKYAPSSCVSVGHLKHVLDVCGVKQAQTLLC